MNGTHQLPAAAHAVRRSATARTLDTAVAAPPQRARASTSEAARNTAVPVSTIVPPGGRFP